MAKAKRIETEIIDDALGAVNIGNGTVQAMTNYARDIVQFEPVVAPISKKRALEREDEKPEFSLRVGDDLLVFGAHDVMMHGEQDLKRRRSSLDRYTAQDYFYMLGVLMLQGFSSFRGKPVLLKPHLVITVPNAVYNDGSALSVMEKVLFSGQIESFVDYEGCELRVLFDKTRVKIRPEAAFDLYHWAYAGGSKPVNSMSGSILIWDIGYLTAQSSVFINGVYQREMSHTFPDLGFQAVTNRIKDWLEKRSGRTIDVSWLDVQIRKAAAIPPGEVKKVEVAPGVVVDIAPVYDSAVDYLVRAQLDALSTTYKQRLAKGMVSGGGMYHLGRYLNEFLPVDNVYVMPDAEIAGVAGAYQTLRRSITG